jgi:hypothetical protein
LNKGREESEVICTSRIGVVIVDLRKFESRVVEPLIESFPEIVPFLPESLVFGGFLDILLVKSFRISNQEG